MRLNPGDEIWWQRQKPQLVDVPYPADMRRWSFAGQPGIIGMHHDQYLTINRPDLLDQPVTTLAHGWTRNVAQRIIDAERELSQDHQGDQAGSPARKQVAPGVPLADQDGWSQTQHRIGWHQGVYSATHRGPTQGAGRNRQSHPDQPRLAPKRPPQRTCP